MFWGPSAPIPKQMTTDKIPNLFKINVETFTFFFNSFLLAGDQFSSESNSQKIMAIYKCQVLWYQDQLKQLKQSKISFKYRIVSRQIFDSQK